MAKRKGASTWAQIRLAAVRDAAVAAINDPGTPEQVVRDAMRELERPSHDGLLGQITELPPDLRSRLYDVARSIDAHFTGRSGSGGTDIASTPTHDEG